MLIMKSWNGNISNRIVGLSFNRDDRVILLSCSPSDASEPSNFGMETTLSVLMNDKHAKYYEIYS